MRNYANVHGLFTKENIPPNVFPISSIPWTSFTGFNININNDTDYLLPIITCGKYFNEKIRLCYQFHCKYIIRFVMDIMQVDL